MIGHVEYSQLYQSNISPYIFKHTFFFSRYVHSTFGYQIWFHVTQVVLQKEKIDYTKYPGDNGHDMLDQVCNWQAEKHEDSATWDHTIFMSNK